MLTICWSIQKHIHIHTGLFSHGSPGPIDERDKDANDGKREESDSVLDVRLGVGDDVIDVRNEEKRSQSYTNDSHQDAEKEDCRVLHE